MYYESRTYRSRPVVDAAEAASLIKSHQASTCEALIWQSDRGRIAVVDDSHIDSTWLEAAVILLDDRIQIESITTGWCDSEEEIAGHFTAAAAECHSYGKAALHLDGADHGHLVHFTCSCCGESFRSTIAEQAPHDQDHGYGHCPDCE